MVSSVTSSNPYYSYLSQLQAPQAGTTTAPTTGGTTGTSSGSGSSTAQSLVSSLLGGGYTPEVLSLLQGNNSGNFDPITDLLGGSGTDNATTDLYTNLYDTVEAAQLTQAQENSAPGSAPLTTGTTGTTTPAASNNQVQNLINAQIQASVAYNQTLQQNVANTVQSIVNA